MADLTPELTELVASKFTSMEQVEVFLLLTRDPERQWSPEEVATALAVAPQTAGMRLFLLASAGLLTSAGTPLRYSYTPQPALDELARSLATAYAGDRQALAAIVTATPGLPARQFADAFRIRKP